MKKSLTRRERLRRSADIGLLFRSGKRTETRGLKLLFRPNGMQGNRMAVVVARGCGGAIRRNREKRITREAYRNMKDRVSAGNDLVFVIAGFGQTYWQRRDAMASVLQRAALCGKPS